MEKAVAAPFSKGVNFSFWLEYKNEDQIEEELFSKKDFMNVKKLGCDIVRIPVHFEMFCKKENGFIIPEKIWNILDKIEAWAEGLELFVDLDFHNSTHMDSFTPENIGEVLIPVWTQLANHFKDKSRYLVYELLNEPHGIKVELWNQIIRRVYDAVREIDKSHYIIAGGADWNSFEAMKSLPDFNDDKVIYTFHFYDPHTFTHQGAPWCHMERVVGIPFPYDEKKMPAAPKDANDYERELFENYPAEGTVEKVMAFFDKFVQFSIERNAPVFCGEYGCFAPFIKQEERVNWYRIVSDALTERNIARTSWDYFGPFGIFDFNKLKGMHVEKKDMLKWTFPDDLNMEIVEAMGFNTVLK